MAAYLDDRSLLHIPGGSGLAGDYAGREAICALLDRMTVATDGSLRFETTSTTVAGIGHVRLSGWLSGGRGERALRTAAALEATVADAHIREAWFSCSDQPAWDAFWS